MKKIAFLMMACMGMMATAQEELINAIENDNLSAFNSLIQSQGLNECLEDTDRDYTPLMLAMSNGSTRIFDSLLANKDVNVDGTCKPGVTPLMMAANYQMTDMVRKLIAAGADTTPKDKYGRTAYEIAVMREDAATMKLFK